MCSLITMENFELIFIEYCQKYMGHAKQKSCLRANADSKSQDHRAHSHRLIRAFRVFKQSLDTTECMESKGLGPVVQSVVSLTSLLVVKMLTALVSTVSNSVIFAEKM